MRGGQAVVYCARCGRHQGYNAPRAELGLEQRHVGIDEAVNASQRARIMLRANTRCEICGHTPDVDESLHVGHLLSRADAKEQQMTSAEYDSDDNLCAMCEACNLGLSRQTVPVRLVVAIIRARLQHPNPSAPIQGGSL